MTSANIIYPRTHFLGLAQELRDFIYEHYVAIEGGYMYGLESGKLIAKGGKTNHISLIYTCKQVAAEMENIKLRTITFSTYYSEELRERVGRFNELFCKLETAKQSMLSMTARWIPPMAAELAELNDPYISQILSNLHELGGLRRLVAQDWDTAPSTYRYYHDALLDCLSQHPNFASTFSAHVRWLGDNSSLNLFELLGWQPMPWDIPTKEDIGGAPEVLHHSSSFVGYWKREKYRLSAASVAIHFLQSLPPIMRQKVRNITLLEDRVSVAHAECHAEGLIPFCQENPRLRIERVVNLWRNVFPKGLDQLQDVFGNEQHSYCRYQTDCLPASRITDSIKPWIQEALILPFLGMPSNAFTLVLDGNPILGKTSQVFEIVQRDAAWQSALDECYIRGLIPMPSSSARRKHRCYKWEGFPEVLADIVHGKSMVQCNFDPGELWDVERVIDENWCLDLTQWGTNWEKHRPKDFQPAPPLPTWLELRREDVLPEQGTAETAL